MEQVITALVIQVIQAIPDIVAAVQSTSNLSAAEKNTLLNKIQDELDTASAKVSQVQFRDVDG